jgi:hypothetical protein
MDELRIVARDTANPFIERDGSKFGEVRGQSMNLLPPGPETAARNRQKADDLTLTPNFIDSSYERARL